MLFIKQNSNRGRLFILQQSLKVISKNSNGVGLGKFSAYYMEEQANYFVKNGTDNKHALLADNVEYALNEHMHIAAEFGIAIGITFIIVVAFIVFIGIKKHVKNKSNIILHVSVALFTAISVAAIFNFVLHNWLVLLIYILCCTNILIFNWASSTALKLINIFAVISITAFYSIGLFKEKNTKTLLLQGMQLSNLGYKTDAENNLKTCLQQTTNKPETYFALGNHYAAYNLADSALHFYKLANVNWGNNKMYLEMAKIYEKQNFNNLAEQYYLKAVYAVPNRFVPKYKISLFYKTTNQFDKEKLWLQNIISSPIKIKNLEVNNIILYATKRLKELGSK